MLDRSIPYYNIFMRCDSYGLKSINLPEGYQIITYRPGLEKEWARLETAIGDFDSPTAAADYFVSEFTGKNLDDHILFMTDDSKKIVGSCIAWYRCRNEEKLNLLHWLVVDEHCQSKGLGRALCQAVMNLFYQEGNKSIYLHTQPWSYPAIFLYTRLGFRLEKHDCIPPHNNQYNQAMATLKGIVTPEQYAFLLAHSEE